MIRLLLAAAGRLSKFFIKAFSIACNDSFILSKTSGEVGFP